MVILIFCRLYLKTSLLKFLKPLKTQSNVPIYRRYVQFGLYGVFRNNWVFKVLTNKVTGKQRWLCSHPIPSFLQLEMGLCNIKWLGLKDELTLFFSPKVINYSLKLAIFCKLVHIKVSFLCCYLFFNQIHFLKHFHPFSLAIATCCD